MSSNVHQDKTMSTIGFPVYFNAKLYRSYWKTLYYITHNGFCRRCCGKIFCADCSENSTPLPSEQLYNPVRVCSDCFSRLHRHTSPCTCHNSNRHSNRGENDTEFSSNPDSLTPCQRPKGLNMTKDSCCENLLQTTHQKTQPSVTAATVNWKLIRHGEDMYRSFQISIWLSTTCAQSNADNI